MRARLVSGREPRAELGLSAGRVGTWATHGMERKPGPCGGREKRRDGPAGLAHWAREKEVGLGCKGLGVGLGLVCFPYFSFLFSISNSNKV